MSHLLERGYSSLEKINNQGAQEVPIFQNSKYATKITVASDLPYVDQSTIGFHLPRISRLCRLGGIDQIKITSSEGETSQYMPTAAHSNSNGTLLAAAEGEARIINTYSSFNEPSYNPALQAAWGRVTVNLNTTEILDRMGKNRIPVRSQKHWSAEINKAIQGAVYKEGVRQLIGGVDGVEQQIITSVIGAGFSGLTREWLPFIGVNFWTNLLVLRHEASKHGLNSGFRWSALAGAQVDRAVVLGIMAKKDDWLGTRSLARSLAA
jgi:hypothetical protein